ncbi:Ferredoxin-dependent glutamate synthase [Castilleja foliolosa]|uniref:Ferredoxin-dependent glutamate synthase n=1 Tax=Castilleja foliolosa TaxID=1961234 RepID=A0ABD3DTX1_9LAMI
MGCLGVDGGDCNYGLKEWMAATLRRLQGGGESNRRWVVAGHGWDGDALSLDQLTRLSKEILSFWIEAFSEDTTKRLEDFGFIQFRPGV